MLPAGVGLAALMAGHPKVNSPAKSQIASSGTSSTLFALCSCLSVCRWRGCPIKDDGLPLLSRWNCDCHVICWLFCSSHNVLCNDDANKDQSVISVLFHLCLVLNIIISFNGALTPPIVGQHILPGTRSSSNLNLNTTICGHMSSELF